MEERTYAFPFQQRFKRRDNYPLNIIRLPWLSIFTSFARQPGPKTLNEVEGEGARETWWLSVLLPAVGGS